MGDKYKYAMSDIFASVDNTTELVYRGIFNWLDINGTFFGNPVKVKGVVFPAKESMTADNIRQSLNIMCKKGGIVRYRVANEDYLWFPKFVLYQPRLEITKEKVEHPITSKLRRKVDAEWVEKRRQYNVTKSNSKEVKGQGRKNFLEQWLSKDKDPKITITDKREVSK